MADYSRLDITLDVFDLKMQRAKPLSNLTAVEFIAATLDEFGEIEYLSNRPDQYQLIDVTNGEPLREDVSLGDQVSSSSHLALIDREALIPAGARPLKEDVYLREMGSGTVYKLHWQPAIIGRSDKNVADEELLITNFESLPLGLRISRRHASITERNGRYYIEQLSRNPTELHSADGFTTALDDDKRELRHGDHIKLERSGADLKFIERAKMEEVTSGE